MHPFSRLLPLALAMALLPCTAQTQEVQFSGAMGGRGVFVIDGQTKTLAPGQSFGGVTLLSLSPDQARVQRSSGPSVLRMGAGPVQMSTRQGTGPNGGVREIVLTAGPGGHFLSGGTINGKAVQFMLDTGATVVAMSQAEADRIGLDWRGGEMAVSNTANGSVAVRLITLSAVRVGEVTVSNVQAVVMPAAMPHILLGNSFLGRFQMRRDNDTMRLELKP